MNNKYNLDWLETMDVANRYLDILEDNMKVIYNSLKDNPEQLEKTLTLMKNDKETRYKMNDDLYMFLEKNDYQSVCNQLILIEMFDMFTKDVLPGTNVGDIEYYIESIGEDQLIEDVTRIIDNYYN